MSKPKKRAPVHPGRVLKLELQEAGLSANAVALALRIPANRLTEIINGKRSVSADTEMRAREILWDIRANVDESAI